MKQKSTRQIAVLGALALGLAGAAVQAQPGGNQGGQGGGRPDWQNMTPEQRTQMMQQFQEQRTRGTLQCYGVNDTKIQDTVVAYTKAQDASRQSIAEQARKVTEALGNGTADAQVFALFNQLREMIAAEKTREQKDLATLDTLVKYSANPRLGIVLTMMGIIGDESKYLGGGGRGGFGGFGGFGGGQGGGQGGRGGRGGGQGGNQNN